MENSKRSFDPLAAYENFDKNSSSNTTSNKPNRFLANAPMPASAHQLAKIPPHSRDLEEAVLGAVMLEKDALYTVIDVLLPHYFYDPKHEAIFGAIKKLFEQSQPIDILTVTQQLRKQNELETAGGILFVSELTGKVSSAANVEAHARIVLEMHLKRSLIQISSKNQHDAYDNAIDAFDLLDKAEQSLFALSQGNVKKGADDMASLITKSILQMQEVAKKTDGLSGTPTGFIKLDQLTGGWQPSNLIIIAGRPGMGKSAFVTSMARNIAVDFNIPVAIFSLEMSSIEIANRLISAESGIKSEQIKTGKLDPHQWVQLETKIKRLSQAPIYIDETASLTLLEVRAKCRRLKSQHNIQLIIIDYLQLMSGGDHSGKSTGNREQEIANISRGLKAIAKELNVPVIALSQLSRAVEIRGGDKRPLLSDLRESGSIEQDADMVIFIYRPEYYKILQDVEGRSLKGIGQLIVAKHRSGGLDNINLRFISEYAKFDNLEHSQNFDFEVPSEGSNSNNTITMTSRMDTSVPKENIPPPF